MKRVLTSAISGVLIVAGIFLGCAQNNGSKGHSATEPKVKTDSLKQKEKDESRYERLTDADFERVARELDVETAAIKAVVTIEAGSAMQGFWAPGIPVINFDPTMYRKYGLKVKNRAGAKDESVPAGLTGYARSEWTQLINARKVNAEGANMGTFWGMFQIGGFCYEVCNCKSVNEFVKRMSQSELEQLELFAAFLKNTGYVRDMRAKNWASFSRKYNGPSYAKRGYHTKMAAAYSKFKAQEAKNKNHAVSEGKLAEKELKLQ